jgi:hypothetical protein
MLRLDKALSAWGTPDFRTLLTHEIENLGVDHLPLQQGLVHSNHVIDTPICVIINSVSELENVIRIRAGIFYQGVIAGCSCADDPTPVNENQEYCEISLEIDKATAAVVITLVE